MGRDACRLVVDITDWNVFLPRGAPISGIQRVTLNLLRSLRRLGLPYLIIRHDLLSGYHREVSPSFLDYDFSTPRHPSERGHMHTHNRYTNSYLRSVIASMWFRVKHGLKRFKENPLDCFTTRYVPRDGDMIYLAGAGWDASLTMEAIAGFKKQANIRFAAEVYDFIPFISEVYHERLGRRQFRRWMKHTRGIVDTYVCLSQHTQRDFARFRPVLNLPDDVRTIVVTPPQEFASGEVFESTELPEETHRRRYALCVAQVFNHKNGRRVIEAWRTIGLVADQRMSLVIAGATAREEIVRAFGTVPNLIVIERPNDSTLANLYRNAEFSIFPSLYEGWGMPVGESLWFGRPCLSANGSSMPEVGGDMCDYFDPHAPGELENLLAKAVFNADFVAARATQIDQNRLKSLDDYAREIHAALTDEAPTQPIRQPQTNANESTLQATA
ncbi:MULTISPECIES: glycosyltransferase [unclassified Beijerinckia]|uniref:glycosyltransferase n=1 Tax=unclassified Beijerinckia TaxID=2638183 RepID=UPI00089D0A72|nr:MULTISPECIES: glycosyltransferase [unclassified Beijerinckia]MDH7796998.1 glycosyltransferase involved in cell wall biosynthesis [Beijerinckia sp. GAS462]SEC68020.1 Glycosyltransferase involved in cell wall bisynthesis [Beijerinckia sp. 28-YEA-48]